ncbi:hypothetical protein J3R80_08120 [Aliiroseovarius sp. Z3]|uniref:hypothetical protein n=1 Tax=Aliiroseovarius sp. Z3 TaxID=2811402 RepID=UPI0023B2C4ED|nr:hypothetical protein [Aliiroseovarius sp. Z3]MDE9450431.1 hypothetical protein [Aliiroseovarius sp. Z3]
MAILTRSPSKHYHSRKEAFVRTTIEDKDLAKSLAAQLKMISDAYSTGKKDVIDNALNRVTSVREMDGNGLFDWVTDDVDLDGLEDRIKKVFGKHQD